MFTHSFRVTQAIPDGQASQVDGELLEGVHVGLVNLVADGGHVLPRIRLDKRGAECCTQYKTRRVLL